MLSSQLEQMGHSIAEFRGKEDRDDLSWYPKAAMMLDENVDTFLKELRATKELSAAERHQAAVWSDIHAAPVTKYVFIANLF